MGPPDTPAHDWKTILEITVSPPPSRGKYSMTLADVKFL